MGQTSLKSYKPIIFMKQPSLEVTTMAYTRQSQQYMIAAAVYIHQLVVACVSDNNLL